ESGEGKKSHLCRTRTTPGPAFGCSILILTGDRRVLGGLMSFADRLGSLQLFFFRAVQGSFGLACLFLYLAGLRKAVLGFVVLARRGFVAFAFVARRCFLRFTILVHGTSFAESPPSERGPFRHGCRMSRR